MQINPSGSTIQTLFQQAFQLHQQGRLANAQTIYEGILKIQPNHSESLHLLGVIALDTGNPKRAVDLIGQAIHIDPSQAVSYSNRGNALLKLMQFHDAIASYDKAISLKPDYANAYYNRGVALKELDQIDAAIASYDKAIRIKPDFAGAFYNRGIALQALKQFDAAIASYDKAIAIQPNLAEAHTNRGNTLRSQGKLAEARASHDKAIALRPDYAEAYANRGAVLQDLKQLDLALASFDKAIALKPGFVGAYYNRGVLLQEFGRPDAAIACYDNAIALKPDYKEAYINRGYVLQFQGRLAEAEACFDKVITIEPDNVEAHTNRGNSLKDQGRIDEAEASYLRARAIKPSSRLSILEALMLPPIMGTKEAVQASRLRFENKVEALIQEGVTLLDPIKATCNTNFHLAYHGLNDRDIQVKVARFYEGACPSLLYVAPHCGRPTVVGRKRRIGFLSKFIAKHSVALCFSRIIEALAAQDEFEVTLLSSVEPGDRTLKETYPKFGGAYVRLADNLESTREQIAALELDVLVYLDIGMDPYSYFLAFARLARTQCVLGGHPVTTGISAMDYYVSSELIETSDAQAHYSEKLILLPFGSFYYERPVLPSSRRSRVQLGLPESGRIYLCPMALHKLHPDFDEAIQRILELDSDGSVVLVADQKYSAWQGLLEQRFSQTIAGQVLGRVIFLPWVSDPLDFIRVVEVSDVVLDSFHFGLGTTAIPICAVGTPFVTKPSEFMRGRVGLYYCKLLDLIDCVAHDTEEYARKAVFIATNLEERDRIKKRILANNHVFFENPRAIQDVAGSLTQMANAN